MRSKLQAFSRYRPRILTLLVVFAIAVMLALSNLTYNNEWGDRDYLMVSRQSYGWPLAWHRFVHFDGKTVGWHWHAGRLAANLAIWLALLAAPGLVCESLLRRYRPRPRWSLRAMLTAIALVAVCCGWFSSAWRQANLQDAVVAQMPVNRFGESRVYVNRWGPKWLNLVGADRFRRRIEDVSLSSSRAHSGDAARHLARLAALHDLESLSLYADHVTPDLAGALGGMTKLRRLHLSVDRLTPCVAAALNELRQLRKLRIEQSDPETDEDAQRIARDCFASIGQIADLEEIELSGVVVNGNCLRCLASLSKLKLFMLSMRSLPAYQKPALQEWMAALGELDQVERLELSCVRMNNESLQCLGGLANLRALRLDVVYPHHGLLLSSFPLLSRLEALDIVRAQVSDEDISYLAVLPHLKSLWISERMPKLTVAGLSRLAAIESLEEVGIEGDLVSPAGLKSLLAINCLKTLHLGSSPFDPGKNSSVLPLDDGSELYVDEVEGFRRALDALRQVNPQIVIDRNFDNSRLRHFIDFEAESGDETWDTYNYSWFPTSNFPWMTEPERKSFTMSGGRATFDGAAWPDINGRTITARFD